MADDKANEPPGSFEHIPIRVDLLPYNARLHVRSETRIDLVVIHCTELPDLATARKYGERIHYVDSATGNSGHFYIDRDGHIEQWVDLDRIANHTHGFNSRSLGIELVNLGRFPDWLASTSQIMEEPYRPAQIRALQRLLQALRANIPTLEYIAGHAALDTRLVPATDNPAIAVHRKLDPGPLFPWDEILVNDYWQSP